MPSLHLNGANAVQVIRVFLASPGDLGPERRAAHDAVDEINRTVARPAGYQVDLVGWEDTLSSSGRPQAVINEELDSCQMFIGLIWQRWGTPPALDGEYSSGFEEEYLRSRERFKNEGMPFMRLFFKDVDSSKMEDAGPELRRVLDFKTRVIDEKAILFQTFDAPATFAQHVRVGIADYINRISKLDKADGLSISGHSTGADPNVADQVTVPSAGTAGEAKLLEDVAATILQPNSDGVDALHVARLRNLALSLGGASNDQTSLGAHDANLLYRGSADLDFSGRERSALADAGLDSFADENAPLWSWLAGRMKDVPDWLIISSGFGPDHRRINALKVMRMLGHVVADQSEYFSKSKMLDRWLSETSDGMRVATLDYLSDLGDLPDAEIARAELARDAYGTREAARAALIKILIRADIAAASKVLSAPTELTLGRSIEAALPAFLSQLPNAALVEALSSGTAIVRLRAFQCLGEREALSADMIEALLADPSVDIRTEALQMLERRGRSFPEEDAKAILVRKKVPSYLGIGAARGEEGGEAFEEFKMRQRMMQDTASLEHGSRTAPFEADKFYFALCRKEAKRRLASVRQNFDDRFREFFASYVALIQEAYADKGAMDVIEKLIDDSEKYWKRSWMRQALDLLVAFGGKDDLLRIRSAFDEDVVDPRKDDIDYLKKYGSFEDIQRICKIDADYRSTGLVSTILTHVRDRRRLAKAILVLAKDNLVNVLARELSNDILPSIIAEAKQASFRAVGDTQIDNLLFNSAADVRKATALKILMVHGVRSVQTRLERYQAIERYRYYNVIFWLDLGVALPVAQARQIAKAELQKIE